MFFALCIMGCQPNSLSIRPKTSAQSFKNSDWNSGHRFQPLPNLKVKGYCEWEMRLNTDFNRIPPIITELVCSNPGTTCSGNTFFKVIYICRYISRWFFVFVKSSVSLYPRAQVILSYFQLATMPERIYNSHYGNGVPAMFTS